jgi:hypothetical protein
VQVLDLGPVPQIFPRSLTSSPGGKGVIGGSILQLPQQAHADVYLRGPSSLILLSSLMVLAAFIIQFLSPLRPRFRLLELLAAGVAACVYEATIQLLEITSNVAFDNAFAESATV